MIVYFMLPEDSVLCAVVRRLMDFYSCDEEERRPGARPWVSTSDSDTSDSNHKSSPIPVPLRHSTHKGGYCSDSSPCKNLPPIGVFWDIENCQVTLSHKSDNLADKTVGQNSDIVLLLNNHGLKLNPNKTEPIIICNNYSKRAQLKLIKYDVF